MRREEVRDIGDEIQHVVSISFVDINRSQLQVGDTVVHVDVSDEVSVGGTVGARRDTKSLSL